MFYTSITGDPSNPSIIFLHGGGGAGWMWQPQVDALKDAYHLLVPDLPEHGRSAEIKPFTTIAGNVTHVAELICTQARGSKAHEEHSWNMIAPGLFTRTVRAWIEG